MFDMDGLIFDTETIYFASEQEMLERRGLVFSPEIGGVIMGLPGPLAMAALKEACQLPDDPLALFVELQSIFERRLVTDLQFMPGFEEFFARVKRSGLPHGLATSTARPLTEHMLARFGLLDQFAFILTRDDVERAKPFPDLYWRSAELLGVPAADVLVLEDSLNGTKAAKAADCRCATVLHPLTRSIDFSIADIVVDGLLDPRLSAYCGFV